VNAPPDLGRLRATLGDPRLARLLAALRRRLEFGEALDGVLTLTRATADERAAVDELLGRPPSRGATLTLDLDRLAVALREAGVCESLRSGVEALTGPVENRRAAEQRRDAAWKELWRETGDALATRAALCAWLEELARSGAVKRLCDGDPWAAAEVLRALVRVVAALPARAEPLASLSARILGDAHALDPGTACATLAVRAAARVGGVTFEDDAEGRRTAWASVGVMCDELSTPVLVFNLAAVGDAPLARLLREAATACEPQHLSLRLLLRSPLGPEAGLAGRDVFVCENPTIVALAASRIGARCAPLVCVNGQFATPALVLLRQLREAGTRLRYHGDFDPAGISLARRVFQESGAAPWRYAETDYREAPKGKRFVGKISATPWSPVLAAEMERVGRVVHEEAVFDQLAGDLGAAR
jgi:uncharacterized protein (TIGR02679 family)